MSENGSDLESRHLNVLNKRYYFDVKENVCGRFIKIAEMGSNPKSRIVLSMIAAVQVRDQLTEMIKFSDTVPEGEEITAENGVLKSETLTSHFCHYNIDLKENAHGRFVRIAQTIANPRADSQVSAPASGMVLIRDCLTELLEKYSEGFLAEPMKDWTSALGDEPFLYTDDACQLAIDGENFNEAEDQLNCEAVDELFDQFKDATDESLPGIEPLDWSLASPTGIEPSDWSLAASPTMPILSPIARNMLKMEKVGAKKNVALITLNRPKAFNALCGQLMGELCKALRELDDDKDVRAIVISDGQKAFVDGADIKEMTEGEYASTYSGRLLEEWIDISKPVIAAVNGYALGGGCELAMMCDILYAGEKAQFGQPEINIGTIPGAGAIQRWARTAGKSMAMEVCLTGNRVSAQEAKECGIVSKVFPAESVVDEAVKLGEKIAEQSPLSVKTCKAAVTSAYGAKM